MKNERGQLNKFYIFSKPFEFPFKVSDLIYLTSENEKYCFDNAPENIAEEILQLNQGNLAANCSKVDDKRLMKRTKQLAELYKEKELLVSQKNCAGELAVDLDLLIGNLENAKDYKIINDVSDLVEDIKNKNEYSKCALW